MGSADFIFYIMVIICDLTAQQPIDQRSGAVAEKA